MCGSGRANLPEMLPQLGTVASLGIAGFERVGGDQRLCSLLSLSSIEASRLLASCVTRLCEDGSADEPRQVVRAKEGHTVRVFFVGQQPETVDFADPMLPPGMNAENSSPF